MRKFQGTSLKLCVPGCTHVRCPFEFDWCLWVLWAPSYSETSLFNFRDLGICISKIKPQNNFICIVNYSTPSSKEVHLFSFSRIAIKWEVQQQECHKEMVLTPTEQFSPANVDIEQRVPLHRDLRVGLGQTDKVGERKDIRSFLSWCFNYSLL